MKVDLDLVGLGHAASRLLVAPEIVVRAANRLGLTGVVRINGVPHFQAGDLEALGDAVRDLQADETAKRMEAKH